MTIKTINYLEIQQFSAQPAGTKGLRKLVEIIKMSFPPTWPGKTLLQN